MERKGQSQSLISGAMLLMVTTVIVHVVGVIYKIPLTAIIGPVGRGYFTSAYELYTPIYAISMAGLPIAVSKMVSERMATGRYKEVRRIRQVVKKVYLFTGITGTAVLMLIAYPFTHFGIFINTPESLYSILAIAPSIFFCCMMSTYRGYYEGLRNMAPTGYSQVLETLGKFVFGILLAKGVQQIGLQQFRETGTVFGTPCENLAQAELAIAPFGAAAAITGVTIGTILGLIYLVIMHHTKGDGITEEDLLVSPNPEDDNVLRKKLITIAIPIVTSSLVLNITNLIDSWTVQNRLVYAISQNSDLIRNMYNISSELPTKDIKSFLYGCYGVALDFRNIVPTVIMTLGVSAIPVLSAAWTTKDRRKMQDSVHSVIKTATLLSVPAGFCMAALAKPILSILYAGTNSESSVNIAVPYVVIYGLFAILLSISTPITNMLQAVGRADVPVKSLLAGASVKIVCNYILVGNPEINMRGAPIGTILCYVVIVSHNLYVLVKETKIHIRWYDCFIKPFLTGALAGGTAYAAYFLGNRYLPAIEISTRLNTSTISCLIAIIFAIIIWILLLLFLNVMSKSDILMLPKGEKIAKVLEKRGLIR